MPMVLAVVGLETLYLEDIQAASEGETNRQFSGLVKDEKKADLLKRLKSLGIAVENENEDPEENDPEGDEGEPPDTAEED